MKNIILIPLFFVYLNSNALFAEDSNVLSIDGLSLEIGNTFTDKDKDTSMGRLGVQWNWDESLYKNDGIDLKGYWDASAGYWHTKDLGGTHGVVDLSLTPVFRLQVDTSKDFMPYVEIGIGAHYLTNETITQRRQFSTNFQFGDHIGAGVQFGEHNALDIAYRLQHLSNAGIDHPNPGINFHQVRLQYHF